MLFYCQISCRTPYTLLFHGWLFWDIKPLHTERRACAISFIWMSRWCWKPLNTDLSIFLSRAWTGLALQFHAAVSFSLCVKHAVQGALKQYYVISHQTKQRNKPRRRPEFHHLQSYYLKYNSVIKIKRTPKADPQSYLLLTSKVSYHGVSHDEDRQVGVAWLHQVNVLQGVSDVNLEVFDVHPVSFTLTVADCAGKKKRVNKLVLLQDIFWF